MKVSSPCVAGEELARLGAEVVELVLEDRDHVARDVLEHLRVLARARRALAALALAVIDVQSVEDRRGACAGGRTRIHRLFGSPSFGCYLHSQAVKIATRVPPPPPPPPPPPTHGSDRRSVGETVTEVAQQLQSARAARRPARRGRCTARPSPCRPRSSATATGRRSAPSARASRGRFRSSPPILSEFSVCGRTLEAQLRRRSRTAMIEMVQAAASMSSPLPRFRISGLQQAAENLPQAVVGLFDLRRVAEQGCRPGELVEALGWRSTRRRESHRRAMSSNRSGASWAAKSVRRRASERVRRAGEGAGHVDRELGHEPVRSAVWKSPYGEPAVPIERMFASRSSRSLPFGRHRSRKLPSPAEKVERNPLRRPALVQGVS